MRARLSRLTRSATNCLFPPHPSQTILPPAPDETLYEGDAQADIPGERSTVQKGATSCGQGSPHEHHTFTVTE